MEQRSILIEQNSANSSVKWINLAHFCMIPSQTQISIPVIPFFNHYFNKKGYYGNEDFSLSNFIHFNTIFDTFIQS